MTRADLDIAFRTFAAERSYSPPTLDRWARVDTDDAAAVLDLARSLRLGENQLRDLWDWAEEVAEREHSSLAQVLASPDIVAARRRKLGRNDTLKLLKNALRRRRFPQLAATEDRLNALLRDLDLPRTVRVTLPEFLEGDAVRIEIVADSVTAWRDAATHLLAAADTAACADLFALLTEAP